MIYTPYRGYIANRPAARAGLNFHTVDLCVLLYNTYTIARRVLYRWVHKMYLYSTLSIMHHLYDIFAVIGLLVVRIFFSPLRVDRRLSVSRTIGSEYVAGLCATCYSSNNGYIVDAHCITYILCRYTIKYYLLLLLLLLLISAYTVLQRMGPKVMIWLHTAEHACTHGIYGRYNIPHKYRRNGRVLVISCPPGYERNTTMVCTRI